MYTSEFLWGGTPYTVCLVGFVKLNMGRAEVLCPSHHEYLDPCSHCVWRLTCTVLFLPRTVSCTSLLLTSKLLLPGLLLAQCTRSTLFISSHTCQRDLFISSHTCQRDVLLCLRVLCLIPRSHSVFFIVVTVSLALWRANLFLTQCRVPQSHCTVILHNASLQYINTYYSVYSVTPVTAQDYNPLYTRVCIHTVFLSGLL